MGKIKEILDDVRRQIAPDDDALEEAKYRRDLVLDLALAIPGVRRKFNSGSIAHHTANDPLSDADGGVVLDRRYYPKLGPDGQNEGPEDLLQDVKNIIGPAIREIYPNARLQILKRAIKITFGSPIDGDQDPSMDLIIGLERKDDEGLWIPNTEKDAWNPSNPELHTEMILAANKATDHTFSRTIRLVKAWNNQYVTRTLIPFNIEALALGCITEEKNIVSATLSLFEYAAKEVKRGNTPDPAEASAPIKLPGGQTRDITVRRLEKMAGLMQLAINNKTEEAIVQEALNGIFWKYVPLPVEASQKASLINALRGGNREVRFAEAITVSSASIGRTVKDTRAYGEEAYTEPQE